jgi:hypothetical protein
MFACFGCFVGGTTLSLIPNYRRLFFHASYLDARLCSVYAWSNIGLLLPGLRKVGVNNASKAISWII